MRYLLILAVVILGFADMAAAADPQKTVLVTGSNRGIGYEFVKQYADKGYRVIATCRDPKGADDLNALAAANSNIIVEKLDLQKPRGIKKVAKKYEGQPIDVVINNAALMRGADEFQMFGTYDYEWFDTFFEINVKGVLRVSEAFWPNVMAADNGLMAQLTTSQGRQGIPVPGFSYYKASKAAIDNFYSDIGKQGRKDDVRVLTLIPGRVPTRGEEMSKIMVSAEDSIAGMIEVMDNHPLKKNGRSYWWNGQESK